jgi:hypothetical protein
MIKDLTAQLEIFRQYLQKAKFKEFSPEHNQAVTFLERFPRRLTPEESDEFSKALQAALIALPKQESVANEPFERLIPKKGWLRDYYDYTLTSEPPAVFHFMSALTVLGAALERNIFFDKSFYQVFPNIATVLIAPTGKCRKTSATNVALSLGRATGVNILSERITPEALIGGLGGRETASGLVYAPELAVFLGKQQYLQGMVPLLTTLFDCPPIWKSTTIMRGEASLTGVALSMLAASTLEWFVDALPREAFSGGFMSRLLFVVQEDTDRTYAIPTRPEGYLYEGLREGLVALRDIRGEVTMHPTAREWYEKWYRKHHHTAVFDDKFAGYHERKPDHLLRLAFIMKVAQDGLLVLDYEDLQRALDVLDWLEKRLPNVFDGVASNQLGATHQKIVTHLKMNGGRMIHSLLLRKMQHMINARQFAEAILTLKESRTIEEHRSSIEHSYELIESRREK